jgi:hypothetical protein
MRITETELHSAQTLLGANPQIGRGELASRLGITETRARKILRRLRPGVEQPRDQAESHEVKGNSWTITLPKTRIHTLDELLKYFEVDRDTWEVERFVCNKWEVGAKDASKQVRVTPLFQVKAWLRRKAVASELSRQVEEFQRKAERYAPKYPAIIIRDQKRSGNMVEISIYDHHFGALIWGKETGAADYDTALASRAFRDALTSLLSRTKGYGIDRILLTLGNDLQNSENRAGTTEAGTPQDNDGRYEKVCGIVQDSAVWAVETCLSMAPDVIVPMVRGNHDPLTTFHLGGYLKAWFRNCKSVAIDNSPLERKAYQHGKVMLMLTHGKGVANSEFPLLMATEHPRMWADTIWRETHTGHVHTRRKMVPELDEIKGIAVRSLPSLRPPCAWSSTSGFVGNMRSAEAYVWNCDEGLIGTAVYSVPQMWPAGEQVVEVAA